MDAQVDRSRRVAGGSRVGIAVVALLSLGLAGFGDARPVESDPTVRPPGAPWPAAIILEPPTNRDALLGKLRRPDLVIWDGPGFERWLIGRERGVSPTPTPSGVVEAVAVTARPAGRRAHLVIQLQIKVDGDDPPWVPIALDGLILGRVTEAGVDLSVVSLGERRGWALDRLGRGEHRVEVESSVAVRSTRSDLSLELAIPPAASTAVTLVAPRPLIEARVGDAEPLAIDPGSGGMRAEGRLSPRGRLDLTWREQDPPGAVVPPVLAARGELAITAGLDALATRETWSIVALRGEARGVVLRVQPDEEVLDLEVDGRPVTVSRRPGAGADGDELLVPLAEPISATQPRAATVTLATKRPRPSPGSSGQSGYLFTGHPIVGARSQTGVIGVARSEAVQVTPSAGPAVRRVDPRTDLPDTWRGRPDDWFGFEFAEQPFALGLGVAAVTPQFEVTARSTVSLDDDDRAEVVTTLLGRVWRGRLFEVAVAVPPGLNFEPAEPTGDGPTIRPDPLRSRLGDPTTTLVVTFARPLGPGETFQVPLRGGFRVPGDGPATVGLFQVLDPVIAATEVALVSGLNRRFTPVEAGSPRFTRLDRAAPPVGWTWPARSDPLGAGVVWLRAERAERAVPVRVTSCPRSIRHQSSLTVAVDRRGVEVVDKIVGDVANGVTSTLEVALPPEVADRWVADSGEVLEREPLDLDPSTGWRRYRLKLVATTNQIQVRIRYRVDFAPTSSKVAAGPDRFSVRFRPVRVLDGTSTGQTVRLTSEPDVALAAEAPGWTERPVESSGDADSVQQVRRSYEHPGAALPPALALTATLGRLADLPTLVCSRLWLRSARLPAGQLASTAQYRLETHGRSVVLQLPAGSKWVRGLVGAAEVGPTDVELIKPDTYRITLPNAAIGPVPLRVDSILEAPPTDGSWPAPELVGGVVQQSAWELSLLGTRVGVGVPDGWADENVWFREGLLWKRRPRRDEVDLARWLADGLPRLDNPIGTTRPTWNSNLAGPAVVGGDEAGDSAVGRHSYLFSRPGPPTSLRFATSARATLLLVCSGPVLLVGLLILGRRPPPRWVLGSLLALALGLAATVEINTALLVAESSSVGFALAAIAALIHRALDRRGRSPDDPPPVTRVLADLPDPADAPAPMTSSSLTSNEPTVIRGPLGLPDGSTSEFPNLPDHRHRHRTDLTEVFNPKEDLS